MRKRLPGGLIIIKRVGLFVSVVGWVVLFYGCVTTLKQYEPKSSAEREIKYVLVSFEKAWNQRDIPGVLALWHDNAKIMHGKGRSLASKEEYVTILPQRMDYTPFIELGSPNIAIMGDKAVVKLDMKTKKGKTPMTFNLVKDNNAWLIMSWQY